MKCVCQCVGQELHKHPSYVAAALQYLAFSTASRPSTPSTQISRSCRELRIGHIPSRTISWSSTKRIRPKLFPRARRNRANARSLHICYSVNGWRCEQDIHSLSYGQTFITGLSSMTGQPYECQRLSVLVRWPSGDQRGRKQVLRAGNSRYTRFLVLRIRTRRAYSLTAQTQSI